jgi:hypothetical protein
MRRRSLKGGLDSRRFAKIRGQIKGRASNVETTLNAEGKMGQTIRMRDDGYGYNGNVCFENRRVDRVMSDPVK